MSTGRTPKTQTPISELAAPPRPAHDRSTNPQRGLLTSDRSAAGIVRRAPVLGVWLRAHLVIRVRWRVAAADSSRPHNADERVFNFGT